MTTLSALYYKAIFRFSNDSNKETNIRRESKIYSYKEQLEELQLRRELEEKRRKEGKMQTPKYTQKQIEAINNQKAKEQAIKLRLSEVSWEHCCFRSKILNNYFSGERYSY